MCEVWAQFNAAQLKQDGGLVETVDVFCTTILLFGFALRGGMPKGVEATTLNYITPDRTATLLGILFIVRPKAHHPTGT